MPISVIIPVYDGSETIAACLEALLAQERPRGDYEIIVVDDGSRDETREIVSAYPVRLLEMGRNRGRIAAREAGARAAKYEDLLFIDSRVLAAPDLLRRAREIGCRPLMAGDHGEEKYRSPFDTLFYLVRKKVYAPYYPQRDWGPELWIEEDNFARAPKGTTCLFCSRKMFLKALPERKDKSVNDDIYILRRMMEEKPLLRHTALRVTYLQRTDWRSVISHLYHRGPRFADYYLTGPSRYYVFWKMTVWGGLLVILSCLYSPALFCYWFCFAAVVLLFIALCLGENARDVITVAAYLPPVVAAFGAGVVKARLARFFTPRP